MDIDGGNQKQLTSGNLDWNPQVTPDNRWLVYTSGQIESSLSIGHAMVRIWPLLAAQLRVM